MSSICCNAETRIGYYSDGDPDDFFVIAKNGTYCEKCNKLCDYYHGNKLFYTDGKPITDTKLVTKLLRKIKLNELKKH